VGDTSIFAPIPHRPANEYRTASGAPGHKYWQNRADYEIRAVLDTAQKTLRSSMTLRYTNNSPDTLEYIWMQMDHNVFRPNSLNTHVFTNPDRFGTHNFPGGYTVDRFVQIVKGKPVQVNLFDNETMMRVDLATPLAPGQSATFEIAWHFLVPTVDVRMGRDGSLYEFAHWYPKVVVYDDVRGWNIEPYLGPGEFYTEFGDFTLWYTVPYGYIVASTGVLDNPRDVLTPTQIQRLTLAAKTDSVVRVITAQELHDGSARPKQSGTLMWKFTAKNVRDVAWAASPDYQWDACNWRGILAHAYYRPSAAELWHEVADMSRMSIQEYSERWFMYPYPQISAVEGLVGGMEYPMLTFVAKWSKSDQLHYVLTHEIGHNWFPMIVGSNERLYGWMDEGLNSFINRFADARRFPQRSYEQRIAADRSGIEKRLPAGILIDMPPDRLAPGALGITQYVKPAVGLQLLRDEILGPEVFDKAFKTYIKRWAFKHPTPADFYRTMEDVSGRRLDWFWRAWFMETQLYDQAIDSVKVENRGDTTHVTVSYGNRARGVLPILARFTFTDGTTEDVRHPAEAWSVNSSRYVRTYIFVGKQVKGIVLDPDQRLVDVDRANNSWRAR
jgi:hypothetical protein